MNRGPALILLRHAESRGNADRLMQGQGDYQLSDTGRAQARSARPVVASWGLPVVGSSDLARAVATAKLLGGRVLITDPRWRERCAGRWEGMPRHLMEAELGRPLGDGWRPADFEPLAKVVERMLDAAGEMLAAGSRGVVVTHGAALRALDAHLGGSGEKFPNLAGLALDLQCRPIGRCYGLAPGPAGTATRCP